MEKDIIKKTYATIFVLSVALYFISIWSYIDSSGQEWFVFFLSISIMALSLWGYLIVNKYLKKWPKKKIRKK